MSALRAMLGGCASVAGAPAGGPARLFPVWDWQFWVVTLVALAAAAWLVYKLFPRRLLGKRRRAPARRATLTIGGRPVEPPRSGTDCH